jgi:hypothetical protein
MTATMIFLQNKTKQKKNQNIKDLKEFEELTGKKVYDDLLNEPQNEVKQNLLIGDKRYQDLVKRCYEKDRRKKIKKKGENLIKLIENISEPVYEKFEHKLKAFNKNNLNRVIKVRNIIKNRKSLNIDIEDVDNIDEEKPDFNSEMIKTSLKIGAPSFLKTKFRSSTIERYKIAHGRYLGCAV